MPTDDYYALIGVPADADRNAIRDAYRARRAELGDDEAGRANAARLNRAWNVLSDPAQRERYDDQLATARADGDDIVVPEIVDTATTNGTGKRNRPARNESNRRQPRQRVDLLDEINGVPLASTRDRTFALVIDGFLCFLILAYGSLLIGNAIGHSRQPEVYHNLDKYKTQLDDQQKKIDADKKARDAKPKNSPEYKQLDAQKQADEKEYDKILAAAHKEQDKLIGVVDAGTIIAALIALGIFAIPTALTGKSPGKAIRKIRLVHEDAVTPVGWSGALKHYGAVIGVLAAAAIIGTTAGSASAFGNLVPIVWIVVVFGVSSFGRNPRRQGWDNRISHTVVIAR